jgi:hypothetical protein
MRHHWEVFSNSVLKRHSNTPPEFLDIIKLMFYSGAVCLIEEEMTVARLVKDGVITREMARARIDDLREETKQFFLARPDFDSSTESLDVGQEPHV